MYGVSDIYQIADKYDFKFSMVEFLLDTYGPKKGTAILAALRTPVKRYALRVNTLKTTSGEVIDKLLVNGIEAEVDKSFNDVIYIQVKGPYSIRESEKIIIADKFRR
ncbi:MAG: hypothetical protein QW327_05985 [Candidatus Odinarchaeota archaeon]